MRRRDLGSTLALWFGLSLAFGACFGGNFVQGLPCERDTDCGPQLRCVKQGGEAEGLCGGPGDTGLCGNGLWDAGEVCDDGNIADGDDCTPVCRMPVCGDGFLAQGEECDDGNTADGDECTENCQRPSMCGNGVVEAGEECDDGNTAAKDACTPSCRLPVCGDGFGGPGEACDDGNDVGTDECTPMCSLPVCNDGFVNTADEACDDGNAVETDACTTICTLSPEAPTLELSLAQVKQFKFGWISTRGAEYYQLYERTEVGEEFVLVGDDIIGESFSLTVPLYFRVNASYKLKACNGLRCVESEVVDVAGSLTKAVGYIKASNTDEDDQFGSGMALSGDGNTLAVGAHQEASQAIGINNFPGDNSAPHAGAVYVFVRAGETWTQQAYVKASNTNALDKFGASVTLSEDGNTLAVGANGETSTATGINNGQDDNGAVYAGAVYVFTRKGETWSQQAYVKASNTNAFDEFGTSVALSGNGNTLAVGALGEASQATGIDTGQDDNSADHAGAVYVFTRMGETWSQQAYVKASNTDPGDEFGGSVALSGDGDTLAIGARKEASQAMGINTGQDDNSALWAGAAYVFVRTGEDWSEQAYVKASNASADSGFGASVALSVDGDTLAVGAPGHGVAYMFVRMGEIWSEQAAVSVDNVSVTLSGDGDTLAVGNGGGARLFVRTDEAWSPRADVQLPLPGAGGRWVALARDPLVLAISAPGESSAAKGVGGEQVDDSAPQSGAVYLY